MRFFWFLFISFPMYAQSVSNSFILSSAPAAGPLYTDNFNRSNENPLASPWTQGTGVNNLQLSSNQVVGITPNSDATSIYTSWVDGDNQYSEVTLGSIGDADGGPSVQESGSVNSRYIATGWDIVGETIRLYELNSGTVNERASATSVLYQAGDLVRIAMTGSVVKVYLNTVEIISYDDPTPLSGGKPGMFIYNSLSIDEWSGGIP